MTYYINGNEITMQDEHQIDGKPPSIPISNDISGPLDAESSMNSVNGSSVRADNAAAHGHGWTDNPAKAAEGLSPSSFTPIAICGMACRLPGNIDTTKGLWEFLMSKGDARTRVPQTRYNIAGYYSSNKKSGVAVSEYGYFLDESVDLGALDTSFFSMTRGEVERLDPQQRILLEVARECLDDAGEVGWRGKSVGVYIGSFGNDWYDSVQSDSQRYGMYQVSTTHDFALSNRISYEMDLHGPSMTIRTACSSSLVGLNEACAAISKGDCMSAIVGGTNLIMAPALTTAISEQGALSPDGSCKTFSSEANGYARAEGVVALYIKPLRDALRDGNPVRAVIVGSATNCDGKTPGFTVPSSAAQEALIRHTYEVAGIVEADIAKTGFFECHGTGTPVGDPIEAEAIAKVFGSSGGIHIGSVKPNLGHGEGASGLTAVIKAVLALEHRTIPPNIKSLPLNENIPFDDAQLTVPLEATEWPHGRHERVSVNSFGVGGANAHVIIDSAASFQVARQAATKTGMALPETPQLLLYSANRTQSLERMTATYQKFLEQLPGEISMEDVSYTLANRREHLPLRSFAVGTRDRPGIPSAPTSSKKMAACIVMVFTGQGSQWPQMGRDLIRTNHVFLRTIRSLDQHLRGLGDLAPSWTIEAELLKPSRTSRVYDAEFSQPLCTALQVGLIDFLATIGIKPTAVVGHSSGEIAAAYAAGGLTARDAIAVSFYRGLASKMQIRPGGMAAVGLSWLDVEEHLLPGVVRACENSPSSVTLSGDLDKLRSVMAAIKKARPNVLATILKVDKAYHSHHVAEVSEAYSQMMAKSGVSGRPLSLPFFSSLTGKLLQGSGRARDEQLGPEYWRMNMESPVLFSTAVSNILDSMNGTLGNPVFLELGPHSGLSGPLRQILTHKSSSAPYIATLGRQQHSVEALLIAIGKLWTLHVDVNFAALMPHGHCLPDLPHYPWDHGQRHWFESRVSKEFRLRKYPHHDLLGSLVPETSGAEPVWRNVLHLENAPWLRDHLVRNNIVFPFAGYIAIAAEGARQLTQLGEAVELRDTAVSTALVLREGTPTELVTTFRRHRLTDAQDSTWWEFTVSSYNGLSWTKHCFGQVRALSGIPNAEDTKGVLEQSVLPNKVPIRQWYERIRRAGNGYGYHFQTLQNLRTSTTGRVGRATAEARNGWHGDEANYHLHPVLIDTYLQLMCSAAHHGMRPEYRQLIPARVGSIALSRCSTDSVAFSAWCEPMRDGFTGAGTGVANLKTVLKASDVAVLPLADKIDADTDHPDSIAARPEWVSHIDFIAIGDIIKPTHGHSELLPQLDLLASLAVSLSQRSLSRESSEGHFAASSNSIQAYRAWLSQQHASSFLEDLTTEEMTCRMDEVLSSLAKTPAAPAAAAIAKVQGNISSILSGTERSRDILSRDGTLDDFRFFLTDYDASAFFQCLGHSKPNLRILHLGSGLGAVTTRILENLRRHDGQLLYSQYVYSDVLSGMVVSAKGRLSEVPNLEFITLDIDKDPADQGLQDRQFDLIIAIDVIHANSNLRRSLVHARKLLSPEGRLLMYQPRPGLVWVKYVLGTMSNWWCGIDDSRPDEPYVSRKRWDEELVAAGFRALKDGDVALNTPTHPGTVMVASLQPEAPPSELVTVLCDDIKGAQCEIVAQLTRDLGGRGLQVSHCTLADSLPSQGDIIALVDIGEKAFFEGIDPVSFDRLRTFISGLEGSSVGLLWVTRPCQTHCPDPNYALIIGLARTVRSEMAIDFATCEVSDQSSTAELETVADVFCKFRQRDRDAVPGPDFEFVVQDREVRVNRFFPFSPDDEFQVSEVSKEASLVIDQPGRMDTLHWAARPCMDPEGDEVQIEVHATGVNFKDVLIAAGILDDRTFGHEAAGIVLRVGPKAGKLRVGDRVVILELDTFSTVVNTPEFLCERIPEEMSFAEAASMPLAYVTSIYSLIHVAHLERGQSVLIHSGCGGVGIAAIQIARMIGAVIYTTVSSEAKSSYLTETFKIPRDHIFQSRDSSFVENLMQKTNQKGVDVALNSLSGELLHATWRCVAKFGILVEIGKRDLIGRGKLDMDVFVANRTYSCVAIDQMRHDPDRLQICGRLISEMMTYFRQGHIQPIRLAKVCSGPDVRGAFQYLQKGTHIGKVIISLRDEAGRPDLGTITTAPKKAAMLNASASYLLVGGLGGLGRSIATWMVQRGARHLTFLSRSAGLGSQTEIDLIRMLESMGCTVQLVRGSVTDPADVARAVGGTLAPLGGIVQTSMILRDQGFSRMAIDDWASTIAPKVTGSWNLHNATCKQGIKLDFFLLLSSLSGILGQPGQANYAAANTFLDAFVLYRNGMGLPCTAIDVGAIESVGYLSEHEDLLRKMQATGWLSVKEEELLEALGAVMFPGQQNYRTSPESPSSSVSSPGRDSGIVNRNNMLLGITPTISFSSPNCSARLRKDIRMAIFHNSGGRRVSDSSPGGGSESNSLRTFLAKAKANAVMLTTSDAAVTLAREIGRKLFTLLLKTDQEPNIALSLVELGLDSLVAVEMRAWWKQVFGLEISVLQMMAMGTLEALGKRAADELANKYQG